MYYLNLLANTPLRFDMAKFMEFNVGYDFVNSWFLNKVMLLPTLGRYYIKDEENRPDLISYRIYGTTELWWLVLLYNDLVNNGDVTIGKTIKYPSLSDLEALFHRIRVNERS